MSRCLCTRIFHRTLDLRMGWCFLLTLRPFRPHLQEIRRPMCVSRCLCTRMVPFHSLTILMPLVCFLLRRYVPQQHVIRRPMCVRRCLCTTEIAQSSLASSTSSTTSTSSAIPCEPLNHECKTSLSVVFFRCAVGDLCGDPCSWEPWRVSHVPATSPCSTTTPTDHTQHYRIPTHPSVM